MSDDRRPDADEGPKPKDQGSPMAIEPSPGNSIQSSFVLRPSSAIELHIDALVLHGFAPGDRHSIGAAVERELARLLDERGLPPPLGQRAELARLDGGSFDVTAGAHPNVIGAEIARAIYLACSGGPNR
jgi:hypothetical protein